MASSLRSGAIARAGTRQSVRTSSTRYQSNAHSRFERARPASPAESLASLATTATAGTKRKERDFESDAGEETNINVVVRCRGRNEREVRENSAVVLSTDGVKGKLVELSMGPSALSNKTYNFDRVFSPAADQSMIFDDVVKPILDEMLAGFNCTIFAYGQTGTGKTYTMSGDMSDTFGLLSDAAGIIPRVLHSLFNKLELDDTESLVKCSFIELYNEELRDLMSVDDGAKLKIYDDTSRKGHATTVVQGMEECHIKSAQEGIKRLQEGSMKRQVAATKCNDLSSRSHTVFTISVNIKKSTDGGEEYLNAGKLNLVDLAGSENIQRSGAENKRAAEAGLINKSLLTLGRVINALVDRGAHIPYRESKLTRLLQDSLGGRTKTCIIANISPAKSNLEETISTLDYAFRAKNIRNKPQVNQMINKKTLVRELANDIEKLKSELIATRQRNGVYLSNEAYEEMTVQSESRRILVDEQGEKIETLETNLRNKVQELFQLTNNFMGLKKDHEGTKASLDETKGILDQTELVLAATRKTLAEETHLRKAHQETEGKLNTIGGELLHTLDRTVNDVDELHAKSRRKSDLQTLNRSTWAVSQGQVSDVTSLVESRIQDFRHDQEGHISSISGRMRIFVEEELGKLSSTQSFLDDNLELFASSKEELMAQNTKSKEEMDEVLEEIKVLRDSIKDRVSDSLTAIAASAEKIAADVLSELTTFHNQLHSSYRSLGKEFKSIFDDLLRHISVQRTESDSLRRQLEGASDAMIQSNADVSVRIQEVLAEERRHAAEERQKMLEQITMLINAQAHSQEARLADKASLLQNTVAESNRSFEGSRKNYSKGMDAWNDKEGQLLEDVVQTRDCLKTKLKDDWAMANQHSTSIQNTTKSVNEETVRVVGEQKEDLDVQMGAMDDFVSRARSANGQHHNQHLESMMKLSGTVEKSYSNISAHFQDTFSRIEELGGEMETDNGKLQRTLEPLDETVCQPLAELRDDIRNTSLKEYEPTGATPQKAQYQYTKDLPQTQPHEVLLAGMKDAPTPSRPAVPIFPDLDLERLQSPSRPASSTGASATAPGCKNPLFSMSLREVNPNLTTGSLMFDASASTMTVPSIGEDNTVPVFKKSTSRMPRSKRQAVVALEGRENVPPPAFSQSTTRRKSPRLR